MHARRVRARSFSLDRSIVSAPDIVGPLNSNYNIASHALFKAMHHASRNNVSPPTKPHKRRRRNKLHRKRFFLAYNNGGLSTIYKNQHNRKSPSQNNHNHESQIVNHHKFITRNKPQK